MISDRFAHAESELMAGGFSETFERNLTLQACRRQVCSGSGKELPGQPRVSARCDYIGSLIPSRVIAQLARRSAHDRDAGGNPRLHADTEELRRASEVLRAVSAPTDFQQLGCHR